MRSLLLKVMVLLVVSGGILSAEKMKCQITVPNYGYGMKYNSNFAEQEYVIPQVTNRTYKFPTKKSKSNSHSPQKRYKSTSRIFKKYNYRYKIVAIDTREWNKKNKRDILAKRRIVTKFGNALGKKAIVQTFIMKTSKKRAYLKKVQRELRTQYSYNNAPFLIFFKKAKRGGYKPYKIISLSSMSTSYLRQKLSLLRRAISSGSSNKKVYASLERVRKNVYAKKQRVKANRRAKTTMNSLIKTLKGWFS